MDERLPAFETVINRFGGTGAVGYLLSVPGKPVMKFIEYPENEPISQTYAGTIFGMKQLADCTNVD